MTTARQIQEEDETARGTRDETEKGTTRRPDDDGPRDRQGREDEIEEEERKIKRGRRRSRKERKGEIFS